MILDMNLYSVWASDQYVVMLDDILYDAWYESDDDKIAMKVMMITNTFRQFYKWNMIQHSCW